MVQGFDCSRVFSLQSGQPVAVAEIGSSHGGDLPLALEMIDAAVESGADIVKFQIIFAEEILPPEAGMVNLPSGTISLFEEFRSLECSADFYTALFARAEKKGVGFLASPFGKKSFQLLKDIGVHAWKVASPELNHEPLLLDIAETKLPTILSTGVSRLADIERAMILMGDANPFVTLLHCLTSYPAPENEANMRTIHSLGNIFGCPVGFSDHSLDPVFLPSVAAALGAVMVEKHFTMSRTGNGLDDSFALIPDEFSRMCSAIKIFSREFSKLRETDCLENLYQEFGRARVTAALGDGVKRLAPSEENNYGRTNRSLHAVGHLKSGTIITPENTALLRTEKTLRPGILPSQREHAYGRALLRNVLSGDGIVWKDLGTIG